MITLNKKRPTSTITNIPVIFQIYLYIFRNIPVYSNSKYICNTFLLPFLDVTRNSTSTVSFLTQLDSGILYL